MKLEDTTIYQDYYKKARAEQCGIGEKTEYGSMEKKTPTYIKSLDL